MHLLRPVPEGSARGQMPELLRRLATPADAVPATGCYVPGLDPACCEARWLHFRPELIFYRRPAMLLHHVHSAEFLRGQSVAIR